MLAGKTVVMGICGGIAAYKAASLCSKLVQAGADVHVIMTESACKFIAPLTFQTLSRHRVVTDTFAEDDPAVVSHIHLADAADLFVVVPATANIIAKMAVGVCDDMLSTTLLATTAPVLVAPAMNVHMYAHPAVRQNIETLRRRGVEFAEPGEGQLACGYVGKGRLEEPERLFLQIVRRLSGARPLQGRKLLVTAGGTIERIDPVRYITNDSSGKMGYAIAESARLMGAEVTLVSAPCPLPAPEGVRLIPVVSAQDMFDAVMGCFPDSDIVVKAAAVADYRPVAAADRKIKKKDRQMVLNLEKTTDILQALGERKTRQFIVGFAAETDHLERHAMEKLKRKRCDLIAANDVTEEHAGFGKDTNVLHIYDAAGLVRSLPAMSKREAADELLGIVAERLGKSRGED